MVEEFQRESFYEMGICGWAVDSWAEAMGVGVGVGVGVVRGSKWGSGGRKGIVKEGWRFKNVVKKCGECGTTYELDYEGECEVDLSENWLLWCGEHRKGVLEMGCEECGWGEEEKKRSLAVMVEIRAGVLPEDSEVAEMGVERFWLGRNAVTWEEWKAVREWALGNGYEMEEGRGEGDRYPVTEVNWYSVVKWCNARSEKEGLGAVYYVEGGLVKGVVVYRSGDEDKIEMKGGANGYRMPSDREWEWAARGGVKGRGYEYSGSNDLGEVGWSVESSEAKTHEVGTKKGNELGIDDMSGNVWEWCFDWDWDDGESRSTARVIRGGSWDNGANFARVSFRGNARPANCNGGSGFRVARSSVP